MGVNYSASYSLCPYQSARPPRFPCAHAPVNQQRICCIALAPIPEPRRSKASCGGVSGRVEMECARVSHARFLLARSPPDATRPPTSWQHALLFGTCSSRAR
ncbi:hypothetical protein EON67_02510 [archaeon]|nr:MAG: hypothetical protein EON67_02510 [archaeon]